MTLASRLRTLRERTVKAAPSMGSKAGAAVDSPIFRRASTLENLGLEKITLLDGGA